MKVLRLFSWDFTHADLKRLAAQLRPPDTVRMIALPVTNDAVMGRELQIVFFGDDDACTDIIF